MCVCTQVGRQMLVQECVKTHFYIYIFSVRQKSWPSTESDEGGDTGLAGTGEQVGMRCLGGLVRERSSGK